MTVNIIAAVALNGAIGRDNALMWHLSGDMKFFRQATTGHSIIMGRRTFESLGRPLPLRRNIVVSRSCTGFGEGIVAAVDLGSAIAAASADLGDGITTDECYVIGGGQIYAQAMESADRLLITRVFLTPGDADTFFPPIEADAWEIAEQSEMYTDEKSGTQYRFETYIRASE